MFKVGDIVEANLENNRHAMGIVAYTPQSLNSSCCFLILSDLCYNIGYGFGVTWCHWNRLTLATEMLNSPWWKYRLKEAYDNKYLDNLTYIECLARLNDYAK